MEATAGGFDEDLKVDDVWIIRSSVRVTLHWLKRKRKTRLLRERRRAQPLRALACGDFVRLGLVDAKEKERGAARDEVLRLLEYCRGHALGRACLRDRRLTRLHAGAPSNLKSAPNRRYLPGRTYNYGCRR